MTHEEHGLRALIALAKKMPHIESSRRDAASYASFETKLFARGRRFRVRAVWALAGLSTCAVLTLSWPVVQESAAGAGWFSRQADQLSYRVQPIALAPSASSESLAQELSFSDGSRVQLAAHAEANVTDVTSHGARVRLARGRAEVSIARRKNAAWQMVAGPYTVRVTGTAFRLEWSPEHEELEVAMHHGSVIVTGPMAEQGVTLGKGQRLVGSLRSHRLLVEEWRREEPKPVAVVSPMPSIDLEPQTKETSVRVLVRGERGRGLVSLARGPAHFAGAHGWAKKVAQGEFESVLSEARAIGLSRVLEAATASDLGALADAARYARKDSLGQKTLLALRERFPESELARDSAFLLGRLSHDERALEWYERYLSEQPKGAYVSQALGRSMVLYYELGDSARAKGLAQRYLTRFPSGPYAGSAHKLSDPSPSRGLKPQIERADSTAP